MMRAVSSSAKCRPVPAPPQIRITLRAAGRSVPSTKGRRMARTTLSTKASCPRTVFFTSAARPSKLPSCSAGRSAVPLASRPSASISRSIWRLSFSADCTASSFVRSWAFCFLSRASSCFWFSSRAAFRSGTAGVPDFCGFASGWAVPPKRGLPPAPNTPFIRFSQSSVYAMVCPPFLSFSSSIVYPDRFCNSLLKNPHRLFTLTVWKIRRRNEGNHECQNPR